MDREISGDDLFSFTFDSSGSEPAKPIQPNALSIEVAADLTSKSPAQTTPEFFYFDLETIPCWESARAIGIHQLHPPEATPIVQLPEIDLSGTVDEVKRRYGSVIQPPEDYVQKLLAAEEEDKARKGVKDFIGKMLEPHPDIAAAEAQRKKLSVTPELNRIVSMAWSYGSRSEPFCMLAENDSEEVEILSRFWAAWGDNKQAPVPVGYGIINFDLPTILVRSMKLGVEPTRRFDLNPYRSDVLDLFVKRFGNQSPSGGMGKLKNVAPAAGIPVTAGDDDGGDVYRWFLQGDFTRIRYYNCSDVELTIELHKKYQGYFC